MKKLLKKISSVLLYCILIVSCTKEDIEVPETIAQNQKAGSSLKLVFYDYPIMDTEPNNTMASAQGKFYSARHAWGYLTSSSDQDWYKFHCEAGTIQIISYDEGNYYSNLEILDMSGIHIDYVYINNDKEVYFDYTGYYYVHVNSAYEEMYYDYSIVPEGVTTEWYKIKTEIL